MAIDFGRAARGIATGYLAAKVADTAEQDKMNRDFILQARDQYFNVDKPQFIADEKKRSANIDFIATKLSPVYANYADARNITLNDVNTRDFIGNINNLSNEDKYKLESTIVSRKKERTKTFDEQNKFVTDEIKNLKGGPGSMNITNMFFPNEGQDIAEVGVKQGDVPTGEMQSIMQIEGAGSDMYNIENPKHLQLEKIASGAFDKQFFDRTQNRYIFSIPADKNQDGSFKDSRYPTLQFIKEGYDDAVNSGYNLGFTNYARDKFVQGVLDRRGIKGFTGTLPPETQAAEATTTTAESKAVPEDGKKFDAPDTSQIGVTEKVEPEVVTTGAATGSSAALINDFREFRVRVNDSPSLSEDEKIKKIEQAKERLIGRLTELGTFNESILRQL